jgi:DDE superfamily endonuclease
MLSLPIAFSSAIGVFAPVFSRPVWQHVKVLLTGAVLAPGQRTVAAILRIMGRSAAPDFQTYHRVLHRAVWSPLTASRLLLRLLVAVFIPRGVVVLGLDDTIERRRGDRITAKGIYRDPVRSSHAHFVKVSGLRWLACMVLAPLSWADRVWALPCLTVLCPSERFYEQRGRRHQPLTERAWQMMRLVVRWLPGREVAFGADSSFAALELLDKVKRLSRGRVITRLRLDAALYDPPPPRAPGTKGRPRLKGKRRPTLEAVLADERTPWTPVLVEQW